eukprot:scaffold87134_cov17-Tisochrysis_lutea.AAC.1
MHVDGSAFAASISMLLLYSLTHLILFLFLTGTDEHAQETVGAAELIDAVLAREPIPAHLFLPLPSDDAPPRAAAAAACGTSSTGISLEWRNLSYCVPTPEGPKALLRGVWGSVCGGEMMALLGASGAGVDGACAVQVLANGLLWCGQR